MVNAEAKRQRWLLLAANATLLIPAGAGACATPGAPRVERSDRRRVLDELRGAPNPHLPGHHG
jgi:hypothetical protein